MVKLKALHLVAETVHYMKVRMNENSFKINLQERSCYCTVRRIVLILSSIICECYCFNIIVNINAL